MKLEESRLLRVAIASWVAVVIAHYLAPTSAKYEMADLLAAVLLMLALGALGMRRPGQLMAVKPVAPLLVLLTYVTV